MLSGPECTDWHFREWRIGSDGPINTGHFLERRRPATMTMLSLGEIHSQERLELPEGAISIKDARDRLSKTLMENVLQATGLNTTTGRL